MTAKRTWSQPSKHQGLTLAPSKTPPPPAARPQLPPGTHCALGHDIEVLECPIKGEVSAHRRPLPDALCDVWLAITSRTQVDLRSETTRSGTQDHGHRLKGPSFPTMYRHISSEQYRSHHPALGAEVGDQIIDEHYPALGRRAQVISHSLGPGACQIPHPSPRGHRGGSAQAGSPTACPLQTLG